MRPGAAVSALSARSVRRLGAGAAIFRTWRDAATVDASGSGRSGCRLAPALFWGPAREKTTHPALRFAGVGQRAPLRSSCPYLLVPFRRERSILTHLFPLASALCLSVHNMLILFVLEKHSSFPIRPVGANRLPLAPIAVRLVLANFYIILFFKVFFSWLGFCSKGGEFSSKGRRPWNVRRECRHRATEIVKIITISFPFQAG